MWSSVSLRFISTIISNVVQVPVRGVVEIIHDVIEEVTLLKV